MTDGPAQTRLKPASFRVIHRVRIAVEHGPDTGANVSPPDTGVVTVGTSPDNTLVLSDSSVSRYHLELVRTPTGVAVTDLGSRNGTVANGIRIERAVVQAGTRLQLGDTVLAIDDAGSTTAPPRASDAPAIPELVGDSEAIREVSRLVHRLARVDSAVLIQGETGTGKEVVARALHDTGPRRAKDFVVVDCGSMPATLIASTLFGHERGAFTGADARRVGAFERAGGGTVLLDEIGELPLDLQPTLLGVLERREFLRVGGSQPIAVEARVLAATHRDLRAAVNAGRFRADLYYRLAVARIVIPPLRERLDDIPALVECFVRKLTGAGELGLLAGALDELRAHSWSGNIRELRNVVEAAIVMGELELDEEGRAAAPPRRASAPAIAPGGVEPYREARAAALAAFEASYLGALVERTGGNASEASRLARMDRAYLLALLRKHGLRA